MKKLFSMNRIAVYETRRGTTLVSNRITADCSGNSESAVLLYVYVGWSLYATRVAMRQWNDVLENSEEGIKTLFCVAK